MIFSQYKETCEVLPKYTTIGGEGINYYFKKEIRNILHANIDYHSRKLIDEFTVDGIKYISKLQSHFSNITFSGGGIYERIFRKVTYKGGESAIIYIKRFHNALALSVSVGKKYSGDQLMHILLNKFHQGGKCIV